MNCAFCKSVLWILVLSYFALGCKKKEVPRPDAENYSVSDSARDCLTSTANFVSPPSKFEVISNSNSSLKISWNKVQPGGQAIKNYTVKRRSHNGKWEVLAENLYELEFTDNNVDNSKKYYYEIEAVSNCKLSSSSVISVSFDEGYLLIDRINGSFGTLFEIDENDNYYATTDITNKIITVRVASSHVEVWSVSMDEEVHDLDFFYGEKKLLVSSGTNVSVVDFSAKHKKVIKDFKKPVGGIAMHESDSGFVAAILNDSCSYYSISGELLWESSVLIKENSLVDYIQNSKQFFVHSHLSYYKLDVSTGKINLRKGTNISGSISLSDDKTMVIGAGPSNTVYLWDIENPSNRRYIGLSNYTFFIAGKKGGELIVSNENLISVYYNWVKDDVDNFYAGLYPVRVFSFSNPWPYIVCISENEMSFYRKLEKSFWQLETN